jgi:SRSO17 transposase
MWGMAEGRAKRPRSGEERLAAYLEGIASVLGHASRAAAARAYCTGLLLPGERKSIEPMAARVAPGRVQAAHQSLHHVVAKAEWSDAALLAAVREWVLPAIERRGPIRYWIIDDTGFPKKGRHSVGVARQYCGQLGKQDNSQLAVSLSVANDHASLPVAYRLYLPEAWAADPARRAKAGIPDEIGFATKPAIALGQIRRALEEGVPAGVVLGDVGYGVETAFRGGVRGLGLSYVLGVQSSVGVWPPGTAPLPPPPYAGRGRPPSRLRRAPGHEPVSAADLAGGLPRRAWRRVAWREGSRAELASRFAAVRIRPAHRDTLRSEARPEEWLLVEWPEGAAAPAKYWLSNLPPRTALRDLVRTAKARRRIERDYTRS